MKRVVTLTSEKLEIQIDVDSSVFASSSIYTDEVVFLRWDDRAGSGWHSIVIVIDEDYAEKIIEDYRYNQDTYRGCRVVVSSDAVKKINEYYFVNEEENIKLIKAFSKVRRKSKDNSGQFSPRELSIVTEWAVIGKRNYYTSFDAVIKGILGIDVVYNKKEGEYEVVLVPIDE